MKAIAIKFENIGFIFHGITVENTTQIRLWEKYAGTHQLPKGYYLRHDIGRVPTCQNNIHIFRKGRMVGSFNQDGSSHDNSNFRIPKTVSDYITQHFPNFTVPDNRIVEASILKDQGMLLLLEDIKKGKKFEVLLVIDLDEVGVAEPDDDQIKLLKDLLDYLN